MRIALASLPFPDSMEQGLSLVEESIRQAADENADLLCLPETFLPGLRATWFPVESHQPQKLEAARNTVCGWARRWAVNLILPMEWGSPEGIRNVAFVLSDRGEILGCQTKVQLDPNEDPFYVPGTGRSIFEVGGVPFGISICHEGFRYPETVRWAARRGAKIVFHPFFGGSEQPQPQLTEWGGSGNPYNERAVQCRALENGIYMASVNYALAYQEAATAILSPSGECLAWQRYGEAGLLVREIDIGLATGKMARRFRPEGLG